MPPEEQSHGEVVEVTGPDRVIVHRQIGGPQQDHDHAQDLRHAIRVLGRERGYSMVALLAIALGVGATTTLFSVTYGVLLKPLPWRAPDRLVRLEERRGGRSGRVPWTITNGTHLPGVDRSLDRRGDRRMDVRHQHVHGWGEPGGSGSAA